MKIMEMILKCRGCLKNKILYGAVL